MYKNFSLRNMNIEQKQQEIIDEFEVFEDWMDKYEHIIEIGKSTPIIAKKIRHYQIL